jgi:hypothetical protein
MPCKPSAQWVRATAATNRPLPLIDSGDPVRARTMDSPLELVRVTPSS